MIPTGNATGSETDYTVQTYFYNYNLSDVDGQNIQRGDRRAVLPLVDMWMVTVYLNLSLEMRYLERVTRFLLSRTAKIMSGILLFVIFVRYVNNGQGYINRGLDGKFQKITEGLEEYGQIYGRMMAEDLVLASPVDTGAFMESFLLGQYSVELLLTTSSRGKPRNQPWNGQEAINRMSSGISALKGSTVMELWKWQITPFKLSMTTDMHPLVRWQVCTDN
jgi:hypothetical protein